MLDLKEGDVAAPVSEDFLAFKTALLVFKEATRVMPGEKPLLIINRPVYHIDPNIAFSSDDVEFHVSFLPIVQLFEDTSDLQSEIYDRYLMTLY